jgi:chromosome partitioning protein
MAKPMRGTTGLLDVVQGHPSSASISARHRRIRVAVEAAGADTVAVIDLDPQASASGWSDSREGEEPAVVACPATRLNVTLEAAKASGARIAFIDTAPHAESPALAAARSADLVVIPTRPGILDLRAIGASVEIANLAKRRAVLVVNAAPQGGAAQEAAEAARDSYGIEASPAVVRQRAVFGHALVEGKTAGEVEPEGRAADEIRELWAYLRQRLDV